MLKADFHYSWICYSGMYKMIYLFKWKTRLNGQGQWSHQNKAGMTVVMHDEIMILKRYSRIPTDWQRKMMNESGGYRQFRNGISFISTFPSMFAKLPFGANSRSCHPRYFLDFSSRYEFLQWRALVRLVKKKETLFHFCLIWDSFFYSLA